MTIKARFPAGETSITLRALHQWDYGQELEIESEDPLSPIVEVHFSCSGMTEAEAHVCSVVNDIATVKIPDSCLEQTANITAWVYEIDGTQGRTTKSVTIPVVARARPHRPAEISQETGNCYTELIDAVERMMAALKDGTLTVINAENAKNAEKAKSADVATTATTAQMANTANFADHAGSAGTATYAGKLSIGNWTHVSTEDVEEGRGIKSEGLYILRFVDFSDITRYTVFYFDPENTNNTYTLFCQGEQNGSVVFDHYLLYDDGLLVLERFGLDGYSLDQKSPEYSYIQLTR